MTDPRRTIVRFLTPGTRFEAADREYELIYTSNQRAYCKARTKKVVINSAEKRVEFERPQYVSISPFTEVDRIL